MKREPKVERALALLSMEGLQIEVLTQSEVMREEFTNLLYFLGEGNVDVLSRLVSDKNESQREIIFENAMMLYPITKPIVEILINRNPKTVDRIVELYDEGNYITLEINKLIQAIRRSTRNNPKTLADFESRKNDLEKEILTCKQEIENIKTSEKEEQELINEVERLKKEYSYIKESYTKENLEKQERELKSKIAESSKLKANYEKQKNDIKSLEKELSTIKSGSEQFTKAMKELSKIVKTLDGRKG